MKKLLFFNRYTQAVEQEIVWGGKLLRLLYSTTLGQLGVFLLFQRKILSCVIGWFVKHPYSSKRIKHFIDKHDIKTDSFEKKITEFTSFNDFFIRKLKPYARPIAPRDDVISSPVDGRHLAYNNMKNITPFFIKGEQMTLHELVQDANLTKKFSQGSLLISRLCPADYHRFHFPVDCTPEKTFLIDGGYRSVHPFAMQGRITTFLTNKRMSTVLHSESCGDILMIEIGATAIGSIKQTFLPEKKVAKGSEKGYFEFGGSTVVLIFENGCVQFSADLLENTARGMETYILMGDEIATTL